MLQLEEEHVLRLCNDIIAMKPDLIFTEKGVSDLAQHFLLKAGITAIRRYIYKTHIIIFMFVRRVCNLLFFLF